MLSTHMDLSSERFYQALPKNMNLEKLKESLMESFKKKVSDALEYVSEASIYSLEDIVPEYTTAQTFLITLFYGLLFGDFPLCEFIIQLQVPQLMSTFLRIWLADDFSFTKHDVSMVISMLSYMLDSNKVLIPDHILMNFGGLVEKYNVADCCSKELLAVFNSRKVMGPDNMDAVEKSSVFSKNGLNNVERPVNSLINTFRRAESKNWFQKRQERGTDVKEEEEEFVLVEREEDCENAETPFQPNFNASLKNENKSSSCQRKRSSRAYTKKRVMRRSLILYRVVDSDGRTLLHRWARFGLTEAVGRLIEEGVDLDVTDHSGRTALYLAAEEDHTCTAELLLKSGADVNAKTLEWNTPLHLAYLGSDVMSQTWKVISEYGGTL